MSHITSHVTSHVISLVTPHVTSHITSHVTSRHASPEEERAVVEDGDPGERREVASVGRAEPRHVELDGAVGGAGQQHLAARDPRRVHRGQDRRRRVCGAQGRQN